MNVIEAIMAAVGGAIIMGIFGLAYKQFYFKTKNGKRIDALEEERKSIYKTLNKTEKICDTVGDLKGTVEDIKDGMRVMVPCVYALMIQVDNDIIEKGGKKSNGEFSKAKEAMKKYVLYKHEFE